MASRCTAQALADAGGGAAFSSGAYAKSVVTAMAGFASTGVGGGRGGSVGWRRAGDPIGIRMGLAGTRRCGQLHAKVGGHLVGRLCRRWPGTSTGGRCGPTAP